MDLTREQILNMTAQELAEATAVHVMGWSVGEHPEVNGTGQWMVEYEFPVYFKKDGAFICWDEWNPAEDIRDAREIEVRIAECIGNRASYVVQLRQVVGEYSSMFDLIHANPEQRCRAALLAVKGL